MCNQTAHRTERFARRRRRAVINARRPIIATTPLNTVGITEATHAAAGTVKTVGLAGADASSAAAGPPDRTDSRTGAPQPAIDPAAAAAALDQIAADRDGNAERLMPPKWWYPVNGVIAGVMYLLCAQLFAQFAVIEFDADGWLVEARFPLLESVSYMAAAAALCYALFELGEWRKRQIGSDYSVFMGELRPRNAFMWVVLIAQLIVQIGVFVLLLWWMLHQSAMPEMPMVIGVMMGAVLALWDYLYDRYFVATIKKEGR
ncbi:hypothetical protein [Bifidobacterium stellenboschense]|uniref:hypothetical protein n=1 Tax=Bifidobacterium stellenboschense TaxID=762211 RepID=UPI00054F2F47|nr:hypothetical protein [Bifidobacterium stellenboschense]